MILHINIALIITTNKHRYHATTREQIRPIQKIEDDDYPHIDQVIEEVLAL